MPTDTTPTIILAGSDRLSAELPASGRDKHPLSGYKGVDIQFDGRPLIESLIERLAASGRFGPLFVAGPASVYGRVRTPASLIDTDASFGDNIRVALEQVRARFPGRAIAFTTCDILPEVGTLRRLVEDYDRHSPCDLWFALIRAPEDRKKLGSSAWKPSYRIVPGNGQPAVSVLPGHLLIADLDALRLAFLYRLFQIGYHTRNRSIPERRPVMVRAVLRELLYQDLLRVLRFRAPVLTWSVLRAGLSAARDLQAGTIDLARLEDALRQIFVRSGHRRRYPDRRVRLAIVEGLSLARDIDTEEEALEVAGDTGS